MVRGTRTHRHWEHDFGIIVYEERRGMWRSEE